ncbi:MAG: glucose-6-phosphate dehydrogenase assembly protein OpcA [candidate division KSB1 bacterium]|nr:glucose-6-phosphate dehydrogenase assembly protein OpcA [candidate division KSB1 bacterium]
MKAVEQKLGEQIPPPQIESVFRRFWRTIAGSDSSALLKAGTLNLVILSKDQSGVQAVQSLLPQIIAHHPGRIIVVSIDPSFPSAEMTATLYAFLQEFVEGHKLIVAEVVFLQTGLQGFERVSGAVLPLLLPDLPVFLWPAARFDRLDESLKPLLRYVDRLVFKTEETYEKPKEIARVLEEILDQSRHRSVIDLAWLRLAAWREATARLFDRPENLRQLAALHEIEIYYSSGKPALAALYTAAWLAVSLQHSRLGGVERWNSVLHYRRGCTLPAITLKSLPGEGVEVQKIKFLGKQDEKSFILTLAAEKDVFTTSLQFGGEITAEYEFLHSRRCAGDLLCDALDTVVQDELYLQTCNHLLEFLHETANRNSVRT